VVEEKGLVEGVPGDALGVGPVGDEGGGVELAVGAGGDAAAGVLEFAALDGEFFFPGVAGAIQPVGAGAGEFVEWPAAVLDPPVDDLLEEDGLGHAAGEGVPARPVNDDGAVVGYEAKDVGAGPGLIRGCCHLHASFTNLDELPVLLTIHSQQ